MPTSFSLESKRAFLEHSFNIAFARRRDHVEFLKFLLVAKTYPKCARAYNLYSLRIHVCFRGNRLELFFRIENEQGNFTRYFLMPKHEHARQLLKCLDPFMTIFYIDRMNPKVRETFQALLNCVNGNIGLSAKCRGQMFLQPLVEQHIAQLVDLECDGTLIHGADFKSELKLNNCAVYGFQEAAQLFSTLAISSKQHVLDFETPPEENFWDYVDVYHIPESSKSAIEQVEHIELRFSEFRYDNVSRLLTCILQACPNLSILELRLLETIDVDPRIEYGDLTELALRSYSVINSLKANFQHIFRSFWVEAIVILSFPCEVRFSHLWIDGLLANRNFVNARVDERKKHYSFISVNDEGPDDGSFSSTFVIRVRYPRVYANSPPPPMIGSPF